MLHTRRPTADGRVAILVASAGVCANAGCPCRDVFIGGRSGFVEETADGDEPAMLVPGFNDDEDYERPMFRARLDVDTGSLLIDDEGSLDDPAREAFAWFRSELSPQILADMARWSEGERVDRDRVRELWRDTDWTEWKPGQHVSWELAYSGPWNDAYEIGEQWLSVYESYCVEPSCTCDIVQVFVERDTNDDQGLEIIGAFDVAASAPDKVRNLDADRGERDVVLEVWRLARERHDYAARFRERIEAMKPVSAWLYEHVVPKRGPKAVAAKVKAVGRNEPCSCGSGKKYKKCCAG